MIRRGLKAKSNRSFFIPLLLSSTAFSWKMKNLRQCVSRKSHQQQQHHEEMRNYFVVTPSFPPFLPSFMEGVLSSGDLGTRYAGTLNTWPDPCFQWRHDLKETYTQQPSSTEELRGYVNLSVVKISQSSPVLCLNVWTVVEWPWSLKI